ncbi:unnamed protein product, partial [marine sediment metagenome]
GAEIREALTTWTGPAVNVIYAAQTGNIGYQLAGNVPVRADVHSGVFPVPGWVDDYEWRGFLSFEDLPYIVNPERGWVATAGQAVVPPGYDAQLAEQLADEFGPNINPAINQHWPDGYRAARINQQITATAAHTVGRQRNGTDGTMAALQADSIGTLVAVFAPLRTQLLPALLCCLGSNVVAKDSPS